MLTRRARRQAERTASLKPVYEKTDGLTDYLLEQFENGRIERDDVIAIANLTGASLTRRIGLSVDVRVKLDVEVPFDAVKDEVVRSLKTHVESAKFPAKMLDVEVLDYNNEKI